MMNSDPDQDVQPRYKKRTGVADMSGELYELKMSTLLFLRSLNSQREFHIASNMDAAGSFDDLVFMHGHRTAFLQLKHRQRKDARIYTTQLSNVKGNFSLIKYYKSYLEMKQQWQHNKDLQRCGSFEDALFIVFTNASLIGNVGTNVGDNDMLGLLYTQGKLNQFTEQQNVHIYELFRNLPVYKQLLSEAVNAEQVPEKPELIQVVQKLMSNTIRCVPDKTDLVKVLTELESLEDLSSYPDFLTRLYFYTEQLGERELDHLIRCELINLFGSDLQFTEFKTGIEHWWRKSKDFLTDKAAFFQDILQTIAANIIQDVSTLKVKFVDSECEIIRQKLVSGNRMLYMQTECSDLSCMKVMQSLQTELLVDVSTLQTRAREALAVWRFGKHDVLVIQGEITDSNILHKLASADMPDSKCVVVISGIPKHPQLYQQFSFVLLTDTFSLNQLDFDSRREVLECEVMFQGLPVKLNSLADVSFLQTAVTADVMVQLHNKLEIGRKLDDLESCYLPRIFLRREYVSKQIFREHITLAVTGISEDKLTRLVPSGDEVQRFNLQDLSRDRSCRYFVIEREDEFDALCEDNENVHWIQATKRGYLWKKSKGDMSPVLKHLKKKKCVRYGSAEEVVALPHQMVLITGEPGMGKSTEMCNIIHKLKQNDPSMWVIRVDLNQYTSLLGQNQVGAVEFLETVAALNTEFQRCLFEHQLQSSGNVAILLDGFDEVSEKYSDKIFDLLSEFCRGKVWKIFVTSRLANERDLQRKLSAISFSFQLFSSDDQRNFLETYWSNSSINSPDLSDFISSVLRLLGTSLNYKLTEFAGIPLQCKIVAEVFEDEASHYCQTGEINLPQSLDIIELYDKFVTKKLEVYCKKNGVDMDKADDLVEYLKYHFQQSFMNCAVMSYFHDDIRMLYSSQIVLKQNQQFVERFRSGRDKTGIVIDIVDGKAIFLHRTFIEYFVAMWFSENFISELDNIRKIYLNKNCDVVRKFLDRLVAQEYELHSAVLNEDLKKVENVLSNHNVDVNQKDKGGRTALHLAIMNYLQFNRENKMNFSFLELSKDVGSNINDSIVETLLEHGADVNCEDNFLNWRPLRLAEEIRAWFVVDKLLGKQADSKDLIWIRANIEKQNLLQVAKFQDFVKYESSDSESGNSDFVDSESSDSECEISQQYHMSDSLQQVMYVALCKGYVNLVQFILKCGVSVGHCIMDRHGFITSMLDTAEEHRQLKLVEILTKQMDDGVFKRQLNVVMRKQQTVAKLKNQ